MIATLHPHALLESDDGTTQVFRLSDTPRTPRQTIELSGQHRVRAKVGESGTLTIYAPGFTQKAEWTPEAVETPADTGETP